jgi:hypothetical protein
MSKFTFICDHGDGHVVTHSLETFLLPALQEAFEDFARGSGFYFPEEDTDGGETEEKAFKLLTKDHGPVPDEWMWDDTLPIPDM